MEPRTNLLIFGASARAAAFSALRAGFQPWCADLFADADLRARCDCFPVPARDYPGRFPHILTHTDVSGPWMYTGGLENRPELVEQMSRLRPLWGNGPRALKVVRSPETVSGRLRQAGFPVPAVRDRPPDSSTPGRWVLKPRAGAGGTGIRLWDGRLAGRDSWKRFYFQEFVEGESFAAVYAGTHAQTLLLGVTRQLVGEPWLHAPPFRYCGSIGPVTLSPAQHEHLVWLGNFPMHYGDLALGFGLLGLFGIDFILRDDVPWPVEVNPRYTASVEVLEYAGQFPALAYQQAAFDWKGPPPTSPTVGTGEVIGKAIYFAPKSLVFPPHGPWETTLQDPRPVHELPAFADIPAAGQPIPAGRPVLTAFAQAADVLRCLDALRQIARDLDRWFLRG